MPNFCWNYLYKIPGIKSCAKFLRVFTKVTMNFLKKNPICKYSGQNEQYTRKQWIHKYYSIILTIFVKHTHIDYISNMWICYGFFSCYI